VVYHLPLSDHVPKSFPAPRGSVVLSPLSYAQTPKRHPQIAGNRPSSPVPKKPQILQPVIRIAALKRVRSRAGAPARAAVLKAQKWHHDDLRERKIPSLHKVQPPLPLIGIIQNSGEGITRCLTHSNKFDGGTVKVRRSRPRCEGPDPPVVHLRRENPEFLNGYPCPAVTPSVRASCRA